MPTLLQVVRVLDLLYIMDVFKIEAQISPIELAKMDQKKDNVLEIMLVIIRKNQTGNDYKCFC